MILSALGTLRAHSQYYCVPAQSALGAHSQYHCLHWLHFDSTHLPTLMRGFPDGAMVTPVTTCATGTLPLPRCSTYVVLPY
jgi:hypothetical protein